LPELSASPEDQLLAAVPLRVAFSLLRVPRDGSEPSLVEMLLHSESDLADRADPMVFPVFGRGRALLPLVGAGITAENVRDSATFLVGPCSCQVKELNPGFDLLLKDEWDKLISQEESPVAAFSEPSPTSEAPEFVAIPVGSAAAPPASGTTAQEQASVPVATANEAFRSYSRKMLLLGGIGLMGLLLVAGVVAMVVGTSTRRR
jgi:hypothetical protein